MKKIINWTLGSFFRTLGRIIVYILIGLVLSNLLNLKDIKLPSLFNVLYTPVYAETFTQDSRFQYFLYRNSDTPLETGTGLIDSYGGAGYNRVQFLYNNYTFDSNYLYDITFTTYFISGGGTGVLSADIWASNCSIYTGSGPQYNCIYSGGIENGQSFMKSSITNMTGTNLNTLWLNFYSSGASAVNLLQNSYKLEINRKENKNVTSENLQNATNDIINNANNNTNSIIDNANRNADNIVDSNNRVIDNANRNQEETMNTITDDSPPDNLNALSNSAGWLPAGPVDSILNLPLNFLNSLFNNLSKTCTPVTLPLPYVNKDLELPCVNSLYAQIDGVPTWINTTVGLIASAFILFSYLLKLYKYIDDTLTFRENNFIDNWSGV